MQFEHYQNKIKFFIFGSIFLFTFSACSQPKSLTILHTNDIHASFLPHEAAWMKGDPKPMVGGIAELSRITDSIRAVNPNTIMLDGGDVMTGNPISEVEYEGTNGGALFEMMNLVGYDAWTIGNHDLDISQENLKKLTAIAKFPTVTANLVTIDDKYIFNNKQCVILQKNGLKIGVIGLITDELWNVTNTNNLKGLKLLPAVELTQHLIDSLDPLTDLVVAVTHRGVSEDSVLATNTKGLDVIIGGHSHTRLKTPKYVNNVIICQTGSNCENLGVLDLTVENDKVTKYDGRLVQLWATGNAPKPELAKVINELKDDIDKDYGVVIGSLSSDWKRSRNETEIGNFIAGAMREAVSVDIGITNSSGIRKDLLKGDIHKLDLFEIAPFRNYLCTFPLSGKELQAFVQRYVNTLADSNSSLQLSGIDCSWKKENGKIEVSELKINGVDFDENKNYTCVTSDFLINQAEKYLGVVPASSNCTSQTMYQALVQKVQKEKNLSSPEKHFKQSNH